MQKPATEMRLCPNERRKEIWDDVRHRLATRPDETLEQALMGSCT